MRQSIVNPTARADIRHWPLDPTIAHLVLLDLHMEPTREAIEAWVHKALETSAFTRIRTGALFPSSAETFRSAGFVEADRLALLERALHDRVDITPPAGLTTKRLRPRDLEAAAAIDEACFPVGWRHDAASLLDIATATPQSRRRMVAPTSSRRDQTGRRRGEPIGFAITGCAGQQGYLQRLAVHPTAQRRGAARLLVDDALDWLVRRGANRAMVNTGTDNQAALDLYRNAGFDRLRDDLVVMEFTRSR